MHIFSVMRDVHFFRAFIYKMLFLHYRAAYVHCAVSRLARRAKSADAVALAKIFDGAQPIERFGVMHPVDVEQAAHIGKIHIKHAS